MALGRLPFVGDRLLGQLRDEAERQRPDGQPDDVLSRLAVSRQLREAVSGAAGQPVRCTYQAVYQYHGPGHEVPPHRDRAGYDLTLHLLVEQAGPGSVLEVFHDDGSVERTGLAPGEAVVLRGRIVQHGWNRLGDDGRRIMIAVGFTETKERDMPDDDKQEQDEAAVEAEAEVELPDLDVTDDAGKAVKGGVPTVVDI